MVQKLPLGPSLSSPLALRYDARSVRSQMQQTSPSRIHGAPQHFSGSQHTVTPSPLTHPTSFTQPHPIPPLFHQVPSSPSYRACQQRRATSASVPSSSPNFGADSRRLSASLSQWSGPTSAARADGGNGMGFGSGAFGLGIVTPSSPLTPSIQWENVDRDESHRIQPRKQQQPTPHVQQRDYALSHSYPHPSSHVDPRQSNTLVLPGPSRKRSISAPEPSAQGSVQPADLSGSPSSSTTAIAAGAGAASKTNTGPRVTAGPASEPAPTTKKRARIFTTEEQREKRREQNRIAQANHKARRLAHVASVSCSSAIHQTVELMVYFAY